VDGRARGYAFILFSAACFGTLGVFSKLFYDAGGDAYTLLFLRFAVTGPVLALIAYLLRNPWPGRKAALLGASLGAFQLGVALALFEGYERAPVALVTLLYFAYPLITVLGAALLFHEPLGLRRALILGVALAGVALTIGTPESATWVGVVLGVAGGLCVAALILSSRHLMLAYPLTPLVLGALMFTSPAIVLTLALPARAADFDLSGEAWALAIASVVVGAVIPIGLFYGGIRLVGAGTAGLLSVAEPLVSVLLAYAVLGEALTAPQLVGGALIIASVVALSLQRTSAAGGEPE
jgi:drug/metabolite transporter (DMT)-like permease